MNEQITELSHESAIKNVPHHQEQRNKKRKKKM